VSYPYLIAAASSSSSSTTKPTLLTYEDSKVIPAQAANGTSGKAAEPAGSTNEDAAAADHQLYQRWQEIRQLNRSATGMAQEMVGFLLHEVVPAGAAACGRIENKEWACIMWDILKEKRRKIDLKIFDLELVLIVSSSF
jgi:hypothetical protein